MKHKYRITDKRARKGQQREAKEKQKPATINTDKAANKYIDTHTHTQTDACACSFLAKVPTALEQKAEEKEEGNTERGGKGSWSTSERKLSRFECRLRSSLI